MMQLTQIKKDISKINQKIADWIKYKLSSEELAKYNVDSDLYLKSGHISLLSARQVVFWIQDSGYKHTSSHEELAHIFRLVSDFSNQYQQLDNSIKAIQKELSQLNSADLQKDASEQWENIYHRINQQYQQFTQAQEHLIEQSKRLKTATQLRPEELATAPDEPEGNETPIIQLFDYFKQDLQHRFEQGKLNDDILKQKPQALLVTFMEAMLDKPLTSDSTPAAEHVRHVVHDLGGRGMIPEAFNTDSAKKHGVLKTTTAKHLLKEVSELITHYKKTLSNDSTAPATTHMKQSLHEQREQAQQEQADPHDPYRP